MKRQHSIGLTAAVLLVTGFALAQDEDEAAESDEQEEVIEEIVVTVDRSGDPVDVDALRLEQLRE